MGKFCDCSGKLDLIDSISFDEVVYLVKIISDTHFLFTTNESYDDILDEKVVYISGEGEWNEDAVINLLKNVSSYIVSGSIYFGDSFAKQWQYIFLEDKKWHRIERSISLIDKGEI